jgi:proteasome lid subunit RPN8/RPN11
MDFRIPPEARRPHPNAESPGVDAPAAEGGVVSPRLAPDAGVGEALRLALGVQGAIDGAARSHYPHEACGLLIGRVAQGNGEPTRVEHAAPARNLAVDRLADRYLLDPDDFRAADEAARRDGLDVVGIWHSHPDRPARPSSTDLQAAWPGYSYLIVSVGASGVRERRAWRLRHDDFIEQHIIEEHPKE